MFTRNRMAVVGALVGLALSPALAQAQSGARIRPRMRIQSGTLGAIVDAQMMYLAPVIEGIIFAKQRREAWVKALAGTAFEQGGGQYSVMVINRKTSHEWLQGPTGVVYRETFWKEFGLENIPLEVIVFESGTFRLNGDGGYINWCFHGGERTGEGRKTVIFPNRLFHN